jgi:hypothetical protein
MGVQGELQARLKHIALVALVVLVDGDGQEERGHQRGIGFLYGRARGKGQYGHTGAILFLIPKATFARALYFTHTQPRSDMQTNEVQEKKKKRWFHRKRPKHTAPLPKLNMDAVPDYGEVVARLMAKMGFTEGMGLGKAGDGIREPVAVDAGQKKTGVGYVKPKRKRRRRKRGQEETQRDGPAPGLLLIEPSI